MNNLNTQYQKMFHPDLAESKPQPKEQPKPYQRFSDESRAYVSAVRKLKGNFCSADVEKLSGLTSSRISNQNWMAMERGWLKKVRKGVYCKTDKFPKGKLP